jgi:serine O-acetyltransferase
VIPFVQVLLTPGFLLILFYRLYSAIYQLGGPFKFISRIIWLFTYFLFGCDINPRCKIDGTVIFPHPIGVVIGEGVQIYGVTTIYQNVTLGINRGFYPLLSDVTVYSSSVVCGDVELRDEVVPALSRIINGKKEAS